VIIESQPYGKLSPSVKITFTPSPVLWNAINCTSWIKCPLGAIPTTDKSSRPTNGPFEFGLEFIVASLPKILLFPSTSSNQGNGPDGENLNPKIKSTPGVSWAASASAPLGIAGAFGWVCNQWVNLPALAPRDGAKMSSVQSSGR